MELTVTETIHGMPPEGSPRWIELKAESAREHAGQAQYDGALAARAGRWLREHPEAWIDPDMPLRRFAYWREYCREILREDTCIGGALFIQVAP